MANRANPAYSFTTRLRSLLALLCLLGFAAAPMSCLAAMPGAPTAQASSMQMDCHPCCSHQTPASAALGCCTTPQDSAPARIATSTELHPALTIVWLEDAPHALQAMSYAAPQARATSPPPPRLVALRI